MQQIKRAARLKKEEITNTEVCNMRKKGVGVLALLTVGLSLSLSGCGTVDESVLNTQANLSVNISVPYATATPLPEYLDVPDPIVIDSDGNVTLNDASLIEGDFQSAQDAEEETEYKSLSLGSTGIAVQTLQARLKELGYFDGDVSGVFDSETEAAVTRFEQTYGTMQTGVATSNLQLRLFSSSAPEYGSEAYEEAVVSQYTVLKPGSVGSSVYALQQRLKNLGYPISNLTGVFDTQTAQCVRLFYQAYGLSPSDIANVAMQKELYSESAISYDASQGDADIPADDSSENVLIIGDSGDAVLKVQQRLIELGYLAAGGDTGTFDETTERAVGQFQTAIGADADGVLTEFLQNYLFSDSAPEFGDDSSALYEDLNVGDSGDAVLNLQRRLVELGYANGTPNGKYGNATINAVKFFQQCNGMTEDGLASAYLQAFIYSDDVPTYEEAVSGRSSSEDTGDTFEDALYFTLSSGSTGNAVTTLQNRLVELGYLESASSVYDEATVQAVIAFQNAIGAPATGEATASFQRYIYSKAAPGPSISFYDATQSYEALALGDSGDAVTRLQRRLWELGFLNADDVQDSVGTDNDATWLAVADAQLAMGYESSDGNAGIEFQCFLFSRYGDRLSSD